MAQGSAILRCTIMKTGLELEASHIYMGECSSKTSTSIMLEFCVCQLIPEPLCCCTQTILPSPLTTRRMADSMTIPELEAMLARLKVDKANSASQKDDSASRKAYEKSAAELKRKMQLCLNVREGSEDGCV